jgi:hypothetical protein
MILMHSIISAPCILLIHMLAYLNSLHMGCPCGDSLLNMVMSPVGHKEQQEDDRLGGEYQCGQGDRGPQAVLTRSRAMQCWAVL